MNVRESLAEAGRRLDAPGISEPHREAASLLAFAISRDRTFLIAHPEYELSDGESLRFWQVVERREKREPFQYIVGKQEFYGLDFAVNSDVLIPRPETEILVERAISLLSVLEKPRFLEIGVGSGCISVSVLKNLPLAAGVGVDIFEAALVIARNNAAAHGVSDRLQLKISDVYTSVKDGKFDAILANPPYIPESDMQSLQPEVRDFEPHAALTDRHDGTTIIERIVAGAPNFLVPDGFLIIELGFEQAENIKRYYDRRIWRDLEFIADLQAIPRIVVSVLR